jgi:cyanophycinase
MKSTDPLRAVLGPTARWAARGLTAAGIVLIALLACELLRLRQAVARPPIGAKHHDGGVLVIAGGGRLPESVREEFLALAGGKDARIVVIPTANPGCCSPAGESELDPWRVRGAARVELLHTLSRALADDPEFSRPIGQATGVWFDDGQQELILQAYAGTEVEKQLLALLDRGGVVGGSSAGAAVMSEVAILSGIGEEPRIARGFGFLSDVVVDQHFFRRNRFSRLFKVLECHPGLMGIGIDEQTAVVVGPRRGALRVIGESYVVAVVSDPSTSSPRLEILRRGDEVDLATLRVPGMHFAPYLLRGDGIEDVK